ncbi:Non-specific serine/threonine protein kinase [Favolaschia claudopus]|uniref:Non-specific serine/threonine protein kinase n=1 Tax=Favolaschia claudopus TaxID=2862362 RepID=A0AAW0DKT2_9AGAR
MDSAVSAQTRNLETEHLEGLRRLQLLKPHPHILGVNDGEDPQSRSLLDYVISHGRLSEPVAQSYVRQLASALQFLHANWIVHRDLKMENTSISSTTGDLRLTNFRFCTVFDPLGRLDAACGSSYFPAPEMLTGKSYVGPEVDVWCLGIILYTLVCSKVPFDGPNLSVIHDKIRRGAVAEYPPHLSIQCRSLLQPMLATEGASRASLAAVIPHPWMVDGLESAFQYEQQQDI